MNEQIRDCERYCPKCERWLHFSRFRKNPNRGHRSMSITFKRLCKACEQIERNEALNADRPTKTIKRRAARKARDLGVPFEFVWRNLNWRALVPIYRGLVSPEGICLVCGHPFLNERDLQIEHSEPPRHSQDWAREHAANLRFACQSCNVGKGTTSFSVWLDEREDARLANEAHRKAGESGAIVPIQMELDL